MLIFVASCILLMAARPGVWPGMPFWAAIACLLPASARGQHDFDRAFDKYTTRDGLLANSAYTIKQSHNGLMWIGTPAGLQRFDGYQFETWDLRDANTSSTGLAVYDLWEDQKDNVWVFSPFEVFVYPAGSRQYRPVVKSAAFDAMLKNYLLMPLMESGGRLWCSIQHRAICGININTLAIDTVISLPSPAGIAYDPLQVLATCRAVDENGTAWVSGATADSNFILKFKPGNTPERVIFSQKEFGILKGYLPVGNGEYLYLGTRYTALCTGINFAAPIIVLSRDNIPGNHLRSFCHARLKVYNKGSIIFPGNECVYEYIPSARTLKPYSTSNHENIRLSRQLVFALEEDAKGNVWIGRDASDGLLVYHPAVMSFDLLTAPPQYFSLVYSLAAAADGRIIAANFEKGLNVFAPNGLWERYIPLAYTEHNLPVSIRCMAFIDGQNLVMKSLYNKLLVMNTADYSITDISSLLPRHIAEKRNSFDAGFTKAVDDALYFVHGNYLLRLRQNSHRYSLQVIDSLMTVGSLTGLTFDKQGRLVVGSSHGCYTYNDGRWARMDMPDSVYVKQVAVHSGGRLWVATTRGIYVMDNGRVVSNYSVASGLKNDYVYGILFDTDGNAWYSSNQGIGCISSGEHMNMYTESDGLQGDEFDTQSFVNAPDGKLFFGGVKGISGFYPKQVLGQSRPGKIILSQWLVNEQPIDMRQVLARNEPLILSFTQNAITADFTLNDFTHPSTNLYQAKMEGIDKDWVMLKNVHSVRYVLPPGQFSLHIRGSSDGRTWSDALVIPLRINKAWWQTWWFRVALLSLAGALVWLGLRWFSRRKLAHELRTRSVQQELEAERQRISRDLHDHMGAYSSALIANVQRMKSGQGGHEELEKMEENAAQIMDSLRETIWVLNTREITVSDFSDSFKNYCIKLLRNFDHIAFEAEEDIAQNKILAAPVAIHLNKILQEAVQNIVKHSQASRMQFALRCHEVLYMSIADNGIGLTSGKITHGNGLGNMQWRAQEAGYELHILPGSEGGVTITLTGGNNRKGVLDKE